MADFLISEGPIIIPVGDYKIVAVYCYDKDGNPMLLTGAVAVVITVRATEDAADFLFQKPGFIESEGYQAEDGTIYPGVVAVEMMPQDMKDIPVGNHWFDKEVRFLGHWFDFETDRYKGGLVFPFAYGRLMKEDKRWLEVDKGRVTLVDNAVNFIEVSADGVVSSNIEAFTEGAFPLYRVRTDDGKILSEWPGNEWFAYTVPIGLEFFYAAGKVLLPDLSLVDVEAGSVVLADNAENFVEVTSAGIVLVNDDCFTAGQYPLYRVITRDTAVIEIIKMSQRAALEDNRGIYVRGDQVQTVAKDEFIVIAGITKPAETEELGG